MSDINPTERILRGYAFDPSLSSSFATSNINEIEYHIPWEELEKRIEGEYIEIIDYDPTVQTKNSKHAEIGGVFYTNVDLNSKYALANNGLDPSESNPHFHQQMVYAVCMTTITNFEKALGRKISWANGPGDKFTKRIIIYPHALRDANAFYSPTKKAILFGYFRARPAEDNLQMPNSLVFTCLSHDIIAHEVTHAILDGINHRYNNPTNPDVYAFHEAFADIVAIFQRFTFPKVLEHQIALTKGDLSKQNLLAQLAQQLGTSIGKYGSLRNYLGEVVNGQWIAHKPDPEEYRVEKESHARGSILVSAMFEAFLNVYKQRSRDLIRIATNGTGILPQGEIHPDLVKRLSSEASKTAKHFLAICIRAVDYCPPIDITFGDYLRAIITADCDLIKRDPYGYRLFIIEAFKRRGIYPSDIHNLSIESLCLKPLHYHNLKGRDDKKVLDILVEFLRDYSQALAWQDERETIHKITRDYTVGTNEIMGLHDRLGSKLSSVSLSKFSGIYFGEDPNKFGIRNGRSNKPAFFVENLRLIKRYGPDGTVLNQVVFSIIQTARFDPPKNGKKHIPNHANGKIKLIGGCTFIFDITSQELKYCITKPIFHGNVVDENRLSKQVKYELNMQQEPQNEFASNFGLLNSDEPFAILHNH